MGFFVYRYIDTVTEVVKYVGISCASDSIQKRVTAHHRDYWWALCDWRIEYIEVANKSEAEALEGHLISLWNTDKWYNVSKSGWGTIRYFPSEIDGWTIFNDKKVYRTDTMIGKSYGRLTVLGRGTDRVTQKGNRYPRMECMCECGNIVQVAPSSLRRGYTKSCGCLHIESVTGKPSPKYKDITGMQFGDLTVIGRENNDGKRVRWNCKCSCGKSIIVSGTKLRDGSTKSCGHTAHDRTINLTGMVFGELTVVDRALRKGKDRAAYWNCVCSCGNTTVVSGRSLRNGSTKSCGCLRRKMASQLNKSA